MARAEAVSAFPAPKGSIARAWPAPMIADHDRACSICGRRGRAARIFRRLQNSGRAPGGTAPDARYRHDAARSDGGDLSRDAARADDLGLGALSRRFRGSRHGGGLRRLVRRRRAFSSSPRAADSPYRRRAGKQAAHRRGDGALHHQQLPLPARRHRAARVGRLCRSRGALARGRGQRAGGRVRRRTRYSVRARPRAESGDRRMGRVCRAARDRGCPGGAACIARLIDPVGAGSGPDAARPGRSISRDDARPATRRRS